jgi:hypothetical protein
MEAVSGWRLAVSPIRMPTVAIAMGSPCQWERSASLAHRVRFPNQPLTANR